MTGEELNIKLRPVEEQRDYLLEQNMLLTGKIATLEKENERLTVSYETLKLHDEEEIGMLKSENAELKRDKEDLIFIRNQNARCMCEDKENLTKAKELLKQWLQTSRASGCDNINIVTDTEQFISEVEK